MRNIFWLLLCMLLFSLSAGHSESKEIKQNMTIKRITPVLYVKEVEPCVTFWVERLGFTKTAEVPDDGRLGFVILQRDGLEIMYQSLASAEKDAPAAAREVNGGPAFLYVEVDNLQSIMDAIKT
jgi:hypothetical protein